MPNFDLRTADLRVLNSLTKYPSIPTYHALDPRDGGLREDEVVGFTGPVTLTEKVDGTNSRIIVTPDGGYLIGSREELLYARGDLIGNPALGIVDALRDLAERLRAEAGDRITVWYFEVYGGKVTGASKQYTGSRQVGQRLFDVVELDGYADLLELPAERIAAWRDGGGQPFLHEPALLDRARAHDLATVPRLATVDATELPRDLDKTYAFLADRLPHTLVALDGTPGRSEGLVLRTADRSVIAKARFQDYERARRRRSGGR
ncbi:RNA ligase family protein [Micromonospora psammae]|uniref:RNA ligase family protein n=1 Tax=Micromonospora sp. CPCC 205556 TaxID=3122398 RepID=UPI002FF39C12